jgi:2-C-methyl-D-erythritol 2,4-cyclodiphosphate synthase
LDFQMTIRVGQGIDVHRFVRGRPLILGGVRVPFTKGLAGHSDADAACHAVVDALLGAASLGDIGEHFPDSDKRWKDHSSLRFLRETRRLLSRKKYRILHVDVTLITEAPRLAPYKAMMARNIARSLGLPAGAVNIKATCTEKLGFIGKGQGLAATAIATLQR